MRPFVLFVALLASLAVTANAQAEPRLIGGAPIGDRNAVPELASVVSIAWVSRSPATRSMPHECTGVLVTPQVVLTARHCVDDGDWTYDPRDVRVSVGIDRSATNSGARVSRVREVLTTPQPGSTYFRTGDDLALLLLQTPFRTVPRFALASAADAATWGAGSARTDGVFAAGFGIARDADIDREQEYGSPVRELRTVGLPIHASAACDRGPSQDLARMICVGAPNDDVALARTICFGDSGGPLLASRVVDSPATESAPAPNLIIGIASGSGGRTCRAGYGSFVNVASNRAWIDRGIALLTGPATQRSVHYSFFSFYVPARTAMTIEARRAAAPGSTYRVEYSHGGSWFEAGRFTGRRATFPLPPTMAGHLRVRARVVDANGMSRGGSPGHQVSYDTRVDRRPPTRVAGFTAVRRGVTHRLAWRHARDDDRVSGYLIEQRRPRGRWTFESWTECAPCLRGLRRMRPSEARSGHYLLPGSRQFRVAAIDRAGNIGPWAVSRYTARGPNA